MASKSKDKISYEDFLLYGGLTDTLSDEDRDHVSVLDKILHAHWGLGRNIILVWALTDRGIEILVIPHYLIVGPGAAEPSADIGYADDSAIPLESDSKSFIEDLMSGPKHISSFELAGTARVLGVEPVLIELPFTPGKDLSIEIIDNVFKRYSISYVEDRAVALFDIVHFSLYTPLEQVTQLNSLAYSVNAAYSKLLGKKIDITFARTTTGDGFYIWNRDRSIQANINLYHFMHLVLADNAIARQKSSSNTTPELRASFHIGSHYEFYQSEGLSPTLFSYIVGKVTIELARMIDRAMPGQVLVGNFLVPMEDMETGQITKVDSLQFIEKTQGTLSSLKGLTLSGEAVDSLQCYLTGEKQEDGPFGVKKYVISDKHGKTRSVYNAKINIYRKNAEPIFLGVQNKEMEKFPCEKVATILTSG